MDAYPGTKPRPSGLAMKSSLPWYRLRKYPHFDVAASEADAVSLATNPDRVAHHGFRPFLAFDIKRRRYKSTKTEGHASVKSRPIRVASHRDGYIFAYYAWILSKKYEARLTSNALRSSVLAYRRGIGSAMDFAFAAFNELGARKESIALAMDLEGFFDSIDHAVLKKQWCDTLGCTPLPADHYAVFKAITRYATVDRDECFVALGINPDNEIPRPLCTGREFADRIRAAKLVNTHRKKYGIPQGSPMSCVLSNIYMLPFDEKLCAWASSTGSYYRRYCDDILLIFSPEHKGEVGKVIADALSSQGSALKMNEDKTTESCFVDGQLVSGPILQYLGFTFDGSRRRIRSQTLSRFWRKVIYGVRAAKRRANKSARMSGSSKLYKRKLYRRFSHLGKANFLTYAKRAYKHSGDESIRQQVRRHWKRLHDEIKRPL